MSAYWSLMLAQWILILTTQRCSGVDPGSLEPRDAAFTAAVREVSHVLKCFSNSMEEGFRLQKHNIDALRDMVLQVKEEVINKYENTDSAKRELAALCRVDALAQEIKELKILLENKDQKAEDEHGKLQQSEQRVEELTTNVKQLSDTVRQLEAELEDRKQENHQHVLQVQNLNVRLQESQLTAEDLMETITQLSETVVAQKVPESAPECVQSQQQEIKPLVQQFNTTRDWATLRRGLEAVLDNSSELYSQLQDVQYGDRSALYNVGYHGFATLASLLLCAGLPVNTADRGGDTILHGATDNGQLQMVKLLLDHGADVNVRDNFDNTPVINAANSGHLEVVQCLVEAGADTTARSIFGLTALYWARYDGHIAVVQYLEQLPH